MSVQRIGDELSVARYVLILFELADSRLKHKKAPFFHPSVIPVPAGKGHNLWHQIHLMVVRSTGI